VFEDTCVSRPRSGRTYALQNDLAAPHERPGRSWRSYETTGAVSGDDAVADQLVSHARPAHFPQISPWRALKTYLSPPSTQSSTYYSVPLLLVPGRNCREDRRVRCTSRTNMACEPAPPRGPSSRRAPARSSRNIPSWREESAPDGARHPHHRFHSPPLVAPLPPRRSSSKARRSLECATNPRS